MWISAFNSAKYDGDWFKISLDENSTQATLSLFAPREHFPNFRDVYGFKTPPVRSVSKYELLGLLNVGTCGKFKSFILIYTASCSQNLKSYLKSATFLRNNAGKNDVVFFENIGMLLQEVLLLPFQTVRTADKWQVDQGFDSELLPCFFLIWFSFAPYFTWESLWQFNPDMSDMNSTTRTLPLVVAEDLWFHHMSLRLGRWNSNGGSIVRGDRSHERFTG